MNANTKQYLKDYKSPNHTIEKVDLEFLLDEQETTVTSCSQVLTLTAGEPLILNGQDLELISIAINQQALSVGQYQLDDERLIIPDVPASFDLTIVTKIAPLDNTKLEGLYVSDGAFCTQCEAEGFRRITFYLDRPDVMAVFTTKIIADKSQFPYLLSNGNKIEAGDLPDNQHFAIWQDPHKKPAYLFALVAGDFDLLEDTFVTKSGRTVALEFFVDKGNRLKASHAMESLKRSMRWDEERFNLEYDLDIYMVVAVDFFNMGAMENKGLNVFNSKYVLADVASATDTDFHGIESVIGHEYFHNWTGNRITCRDWFQLSLKEGLTVFRDQEFSSDMGSRAVNRIDAVKVIRSHQFAEDAGPMSHPIRPNVVMEMNNFYTVTVYNKGAEVIRMIHTLLGEERFQSGMANYISRFDGQAVTCDDFIDAMEQGGNADLSQFRYWYSQSGTPIVNITQAYNEQTAQLTLTIEQRLPQGNNELPTHPFHLPIKVEVLSKEGQNVKLAGALDSQVLELKQASQKFVLNDIPAGATAAFFGDFSAPVKTEFTYSTPQLIHILSYSNNEFSRWDSAQQLLTSAIVNNIGRDNGDMSVDPSLINSLELVINNASLDPALVALMIELPSLGTLFETFDEVDVDSLIAARDFVKITLSTQLQATLSQRYAECVQALDGANADQAIGLRALKNTLLSLLSVIATATNDKLISEQAARSCNMTDSISALSCAYQHNAPCASRLLAEFEHKWADNGLVMDKWFATVGSNPTAQAIEEIELAFEHKAFSWQNPNRVRSLIGAFCMNNQRQFHAIDGSGYQFLTDQLIKLNEINPQIAARLITPLMGWRKIRGQRAQLMKVQLQRLGQLPHLAKDLVEKVELSLTGE